MRASGVERALEVVEDGQQPLDDAQARAFDELRLLADLALAEVLEVGLQAHELVEPVVGKLLQLVIDAVLSLRPARRSGQTRACP